MDRGSISQTGAVHAAIFLRGKITAADSLIMSRGKIIAANPHQRHTCWQHKNSKCDANDPHPTVSHSLTQNQHKMALRHSLLELPRSLPNFTAKPTLLKKRFLSIPASATAMASTARKVNQTSHPSSFLFETLSVMGSIACAEIALVRFWFRLPMARSLWRL